MLDWPIGRSPWQRAASQVGAVGPWSSMVAVVSAADTYPRRGTSFPLSAKEAPGCSAVRRDLSVGGC